MKKTFLPSLSHRLVILQPVSKIMKAGICSVEANLAS